jgi:hypothetical protein
MSARARRKNRNRGLKKGVRAAVYMPVRAL